MFDELDNDYIEYCNDDNPWIEINNDDDIADFFKRYDFHDTYIESIIYSSGTMESGKNSIIADGSHNMIITIISCWYGRLEMLFTKVRRFSLQGWSDSLFGNEMHDSIIEFRTDLFGKKRDDRVVVWSDCGCAYPQEINLGDDCTTFVIADRLKWRFVKE